MKVDRGYAIWLYGSHSRGNADLLSDVDILFITDDDTDDSPLQKLQNFPKAPTISRYHWSEIERMAKYGSLFLWHLSLEGSRISESPRAIGRLSALLRSLGPYQLATRDLLGFRIVHSDVDESLRDDGASVMFEIATLATVFRHAAILGCNLFAAPCFARVEPVAILVDVLGLPKVWADEFPRFYSYRLYEDGRATEIQPPSIEYAWMWHARIEVLLTELGRRISG